jgi:hypothetical protein
MRWSKNNPYQEKSALLHLLWKQPGRNTAAKTSKGKAEKQLLPLFF